MGVFRNSRYLLGFYDKGILLLFFFFFVFLGGFARCKLPLLTGLRAVRELKASSSMIVT